MADNRRLIDVNKVIDQMQKCIDESPYERDSIASYTFGAIIECLKKEPTVEAVEVVHSQWDTVFYERNGTLASYSHLCPKCKYFYRDVRFKGHNYCPNCGADMRGYGNG